MKKTIIITTIFIAWLVITGLVWKMTNVDPIKDKPFVANADLKIAVCTDIHYISESLRDDGKAFKDFNASGDIFYREANALWFNKQDS